MSTLQEAELNISVIMGFLSVHDRKVAKLIVCKSNAALSVKQQVCL